jgi:hypothetical protein
MDDLDAALDSIRTMRSHLARSADFRFYGPAAIGASGLLAVIAAWLQARFIPVPAAHLVTYVGLWAGTAVLACAIIGTDVCLRARRTHSGLADEMVYEAAGQLLPAGAAGALLTFVLIISAPQSGWMLPGLWQIILSLGVFSASRTLPPAMRLVGFWYAASGLACLALGQGAHSLSPWAMGLSFGFGESLAALIIASTGGPHE